jgi:predicted molibdopterin-dependent oxidoreductase YjgC
MLGNAMLSYETVLTTCTYCGCGCGLLLEVLDGEVVGTLPQKDHPINQGKLCIKGWSVHEFIHNQGRLKKPLLRKDGLHEETSWEEAFDRVASHLLKIKEERGPDSIAGLTSAKCSNEENYLFQKWMRAVVGTNNVDHCARL